MDILRGAGALLLVAAMALWYFWPAAADDSPDAEMTATVESAAVAKATPTPLPTLEADLLADIVDGAGVRTGLVAPRTLEIKGVSFVVQPVAIEAGDWPRPEDARAVSWVFGTVVNYALGLEATPSNKELLAGLAPGDELLLRMSTGPAYRFSFIDAVRVSPQASEIFRQRRPGLTLALLGDGSQATRIIIRAAYRPDSELAQTGDDAATPVELGQPARLDSLRLTVLAAEPQPAAAAPPGHVYLQVTYRLRHTAETLPLATGALSHRLTGQSGVPYPLAPVGEAQLPATLQPGQTLTVTAIYVTPDAALAEPLTWRFSAGPGGPAAQVTLPPYSGPLAPAVTLKEASVQEERLTLTVQIRAALRAVQLSAADVRVEGGQVDLLTHFPWQVAPGQTQEFSLIVTPAANPLRVGLLQQGFEIRY